jgi:hypothetical protein
MAGCSASVAGIGASVTIITRVRAGVFARVNSGFTGIGLGASVTGNLASVGLNFTSITGNFTSIGLGLTGISLFDASVDVSSTSVGVLTRGGASEQEGEGEQGDQELHWEPHFMGYGCSVSCGSAARPWLTA